MKTLPCTSLFFLLLIQNSFDVCAQVNENSYTLIPANAIWHYQLNSEFSDNEWLESQYNDSSWDRGKSGFGYGDNDDRTLLELMQGHFDRLRIRHHFKIKNPVSIETIFLYMRYDDGFVAHLNGREIARSAVKSNGHSYSVDSHEADAFELFRLNSNDLLLHKGKNLLAIEGFNRSLKSSDFSLQPVVLLNRSNNPGLEIVLSKEQWLSDLNFLQQRLDDQSSYVLLEKFDSKKELNQLNVNHPNEFSGHKFAQNLQKLIAKIGDAHAKIKVNLDEFGHRFLPFVLADSASGVIALSKDQTQLLDDNYPLVKSIDGIALNDWLNVAGRYVVQASNQLIRHQSLRQLRSLERMRDELGLSDSKFVELTLQSIDGLTKKTLKLKTSKKRLASGKIAFGESRMLKDNIGYLRIDSMYDAVDDVVDEMKSFQNTAGLIIDVRGNRGGRYEILNALYGFFIDEDALPYVSNIAAYRLSDKFETDHLHYRPTYRESHQDWSKSQRVAINNAMLKFDPEWQLPANKFSDWHYMLLGKVANLDQFYYNKPVVVLSNPASFSATDGFLSAFSDLPQVTLIGQASAGGSGATQNFRLPYSGIEVALSSMASFRPNGKLYDGNGVEVDIQVMPELSDYLGDSDAQLQQAIDWIHQKQ